MNVKWKKYEIAWLVIAVVTVLCAIIFKHIKILENNSLLVMASDISAVLGVIYVILIAKQDRKAYWFGFGNVILYAIVVYSQDLYISAAYNLFYSFPILIYGYFHWGKLEKVDNDGVKEFSLREKILGLIFIIFAVVGFALMSEKLLGGNKVWIDSIVSVLVCVAMFLLTQKYVEQWLLFIISNFMGIILFLPKSVTDLANIDLFAMWSVYFINSIYGYVSWKKVLTRKKD